MDSRILPAEDSRDSAELAFHKVVHVILGVYVWEWCISLDFDWQFITRKKPFHWPMAFYFLNRYSTLFSLMGIIIGVDATSPINCQALYNFNTSVGASAIGLASLNLSLRTMVIWNRPWYIVAPLIIISLGHFGLLLHAVTISGIWITGKGCVTTFADGPVLMATYIYTMTFDFIILSLTAVKLFMTTTGSPSRLKNLIFRDGLVYFVIVFLTNVITTTIISVSRSPAISVITSPPSAIVSTIVACRVVRRLHNYSPSGPETFSSPTSPLAFHSNRVRPNVSTVLTDGFCVQMDNSVSPEVTKETPVKFDADAGQTERKYSYDFESWQIQQPSNSLSHSV